MVNILGLNSGPIDNPAVPLWRPDRLLEGANGGVMGLFDLSYSRCYPGAATGRDPVSGDVIKDIATIQVDGSQSATTHNGAIEVAYDGGIPDYAGNGFDYAAVPIIGTVIATPDIAAHVVAQTEQYWFQKLYLRLPTKAQWHSGSSVRPFSAFTTDANGFQAEPDLLTIGQAYSAGLLLRAVRTTAAGVYEQLQFAPFDAHFGQVAQILWWRNAAGIGLQLRTAAGGIQSVTGAVGAKTTQDLTGKKWRVGLGTSFWPGTPGNPAKFRVFRGWIEDTEASGRDARTVADEDWQRVVARPSRVAFS